MSWRDDYRPGSFRGVPFRTQAAERQGGRRGVTHEFPGRDTPWTEDLGRRARRYTLDCFVAGDDYFGARDALEAALEAPGPGTLIHPYVGTLTVNIEDYSVRESTDEGGVAFFTLSVVESGAPIATDAGVDTGDVAIARADAVTAAAPAAFASRFDVTGVASFVEDAATDLVRRTAAIAAIAGGLQGGIGPALRAFESGLSVLPEGATALVRSPLMLAQAVTGLIQSIGALGGTPAARIAGLTTLVGFGDTVPATIGATTARNRQRDNAVAYVDLVTTVAAAELVRAITIAPLTSYSQAAQLRDSAAELIERQLVCAADAGRDEVAERYAQLIEVMVADVTARGGTLARVYGFVPPRTTPALVIAARLYGPRASVDRAADLISRNRVRHPGFVAGGRSIEVTSIEAAGARNG
ncbi:MULTISPECIES: DNA circularization protein [unclassified Sphingomonas]|uniref:DNA circularization protein n=1 Tax=unclassified Sphingomonas TaxID=196159 RepID=UPI00082F7A97|nr:MULTISPECIES: DNA circularization N-terminal domain-containing protein [unclassified Sphingomonas]